MRQFEEQLSDRYYRSIEQALVVWIEDFRAKKHNGNVGFKAPSYGNKIDLLPLEDVKARMLAGLGSGRPGFGFGLPRQAPDLEF